MKKWLCFILALLMLVPMCACGKIGADGGKAVILVDSNWFINNKAIPIYMEYLYGECNIEFQVLPQNADEREAAIQAVRTEIMAGRGPDAFILSTYENVLLDDAAEDSSRREVLFTNVEKAMRTGIFLPLDDLIAESEYLNMNEHNEVIMAAGRTDEGQMVLPLHYVYEACSFFKVELEDPDIYFEDWEAVLNCPDEQLSKLIEYEYAGGNIVAFGRQYPKIVDYDTETLLLTPELLVEDMKKISGITPQLPGDHYDVSFDLTPQFQTGYYDDFGFNVINHYTERYPEEDEQSIVAFPNKDGGMTAFITSYVAINRNSEHVEEVFKYIELMYDNDVQSNNGYYDEETNRTYGRNAIPVYAEEVGSNLGGLVTCKTAYSDMIDNAGMAAFAEEMHARTNSARFFSDMDLVLYDAWAEICWFAVSEEEMYAAAEKAIDEMNMIMAE